MSSVFTHLTFNSFKFSRIVLMACQTRSRGKKKAVAKPPTMVALTWALSAQTATSGEPIAPGEGNHSPVATAPALVHPVIPAMGGPVVPAVGGPVVPAAGSPVVPAVGGPIVPAMGSPVVPTVGSSVLVVQDLGPGAGAEIRALEGEYSTCLVRISLFIFSFSFFFSLASYCMK